MKNYPPEFKADAVALHESRPEATIRSVAADLGVSPETGCGRPEQVVRGRRTQEPARWRRRTRLCRRRCASLRGNARSCAKRRSISPGRRAGEPLPVCRRPPAPARRQAALQHPRRQPLELLLLAPDGRGPGRPEGGRRSLGRPENHGMNVQVLADPFGRLLWASAALPGSTHDLTWFLSSRSMVSESRRNQIGMYLGEQISRLLSILVLPDQISKAASRIENG